MINVCWWIFIDSKRLRLCNRRIKSLLPKQKESERNNLDNAIRKNSPLTFSKIIYATNFWFSFHLLQFLLKVSIYLLLFAFDLLYLLNCLLFKILLEFQHLRVAFFLLIRRKSLIYHFPCKFLDLILKLIWQFPWPNYQILYFRLEW